MTTRQPRFGEGFVQPRAGEAWPPSESPETVFAEVLKDYNPGYMGPEDWANATKETLSRGSTLLRKMAYEIWKDSISRVAGDERLLLPTQLPEKRVYELDAAAARKIPHRFISRSILNRGKIKAIGEVLRQFPAEYHDTAVLLVHGGWLNYEKFSFRDKFIEIMRRDMDAGTRVTRKWFGHDYSFSISPRYLVMGTALVAKEVTLAAYHTLRARAHQYQDANEPEKLQDSQKPKAVMFLCHDSRVDGQTTMDVPGIGRVFIDRTVGGLIEDSNDPMVMNDTSLYAFTHAMESGAKEIIITTHGRCGCVKNGICRHDQPAIPTMTIGQQVMHTLSRSIRYGVDAIKRDGDNRMRDYAMSLFDMEGAELKYINGEANELAVEALTGLHRLALTRNFVANYTASKLNAPLKEMEAAGDHDGMRVYLQTLAGEKKITTQAHERLLVSIENGQKILLGKDDVIPDVKVRLVHKEIRTLDTHMWNDDAARFVRMTHNRALRVDPDETPPDRPEKSGAVGKISGGLGKLRGIMLNL